VILTKNRGPEHTNTVFRGSMSDGGYTCGIGALSAHADRPSGVSSL